MKNPFESLEKSLGIGVVVLILIMAAGLGSPDAITWTLYLHVISGVMWIGILWYFNFVQIPSMPKIPDEQKPAISKVIAPTALFWFRWAALATVVTGLTVAHINTYLVESLTFQSNKVIGLGMWMALLMAFNVWFIIWPNQQKALGLVEAAPDAKKAAARLAMLTSRFNTMLSVPMLFCMVGARYIG